MKYSIDFDSKTAHVVANNISAAGWLGFAFAKEYRNLVDDGWRIEVYEKEQALRPFPRGAGGLGNLAESILAGSKECCHSCCCERCHGYSAGNSCCKR